MTGLENANIADLVLNLETGLTLKRNPIKLVSHTPRERERMAGCWVAILGYRHCQGRIQGVHPECRRKINKRKKKPNTTHSGMPHVSTSQLRKKERKGKGRKKEIKKDRKNERQKEIQKERKKEMQKEIHKEIQKERKETCLSSLYC